MIDSLLNRKKSNSNSSIGSLSIEILPEFGWPRGNGRVFGPGTLFQGYVIVKCNESSAKATRLRLVFQGSEAMLTYDVGPGVIRTQTNQLFGVRSVLWQKTDHNELLDAATTYKFLFTIQMPLVQYPPSMDHTFYRCCYKLSAYLDPSLGYGEVPVMTQVKIDYIPLTETKLLKTPLYLKDLKKRKKQIPPASVKLHSIQFLSGDNIQANICITNEHASSNGSSSVAPFLFEYSVTLNLYQISKFHLDEEPILVRLVCTQSHVINANDASNNSIERCQYPVSLKIDEELPPSFDYSQIMSLSYKLKIKVYIKKTRASFCSAIDGQSKKRVKEMMSTLPWTSSTMSMFETPIIIGTMGRGIRVMDGLRVYSKYNSRRDDPLPTPKFVKNLVHEDELPKYEPARLPRYNDSYNQEQTAPIGEISAATPVTIIRSTL